MFTRDAIKHLRVNVLNNKKLSKDYRHVAGKLQHATVFDLGLQPLLSTWSQIGGYGVCLNNHADLDTVTRIGIKPNLPFNTLALEFMEYVGDFVDSGTVLENLVKRINLYWYEFVDQSIIDDHEECDIPLANLVNSKIPCCANFFYDPFHKMWVLNPAVRFLEGMEFYKKEKQWAYGVGEWILDWKIKPLWYCAKSKEWKEPTYPSSPASRLDDYWILNNFLYALDLGAEVSESKHVTKRVDLLRGNPKYKPNPFYIYRTLRLPVLETPEGQIGEASDYFPLDRNPPRQHVRRGHWRHYKETGKTVWVKTAVVGKHNHGLLDKDYQVTA